MEKLEAGAYRCTDPNNSEVDIILLVKGKAPFLKIDTIWDNINMRTNVDFLRGVDPEKLTWVRI
jgi:hypothetical protein